MKMLDKTKQYPNSLAYCAPGFKQVPILKSNKTAETILEDVSEYFSVSIDELKENSRKEKIVFPRHIAMYLIYCYTEISLREIGKIFKRDRTTAIHAIRLLKQYLNASYENNRTDLIKAFFYKHSYNTKVYNRTKSTI